MKKLLIVLVMIALVSTAAFAEDDFFRFGLWGSVTGMDFLSLESPVVFKTLNLGCTLQIAQSFVFRPYAIFYMDENYESYNGEDQLDSRTQTFGGGIDIIYSIPMNDAVSLFFGAGFFFYQRQYSGWATGATYYQDSQSYRDVLGIPVFAGIQYNPASDFGIFVQTGFLYMTSNYSSENYNSAGDVTSEDHEREVFLLFQPVFVGVVIYL